MYINMYSLAWSINFIGNLGIRNLFKGGWSHTKDSLFTFIYLAVPFCQSWLKSTVQTTVLVPKYETGWCTFYGVVELNNTAVVCIVESWLSRSF